MPKSDELRYGAPGETAVHLCVDMQRMFAEATDWKMSWLERVLPNIVSITSAHPEDDLHPLHSRPEARPGRRNVAALLRALGIDDDRRTRLRNDRARPGTREVRSPSPNLREARLLSLDRNRFASAAAE